MLVLSRFIIFIKERGLFFIKICKNVSSTILQVKAFKRRGRLNGIPLGRRPA